MTSLLYPDAAEHILIALLFLDLDRDTVVGAASEFERLPRQNVSIPPDLQPPPARQQPGETTLSFDRGPELHTIFTTKHPHQHSPTRIDNVADQLSPPVWTDRYTVDLRVSRMDPWYSHNLDDRNVGHSVSESQMPGRDHPESHRRIGRNPPRSRKAALKPSMGHHSVVRHQQTADGPGFESCRSEEGDSRIGQAGTPAVTSSQDRNRVLIPAA